MVFIYKARLKKAEVTDTGLQDLVTLGAEMFIHILLGLLVLLITC